MKTAVLLPLAAAAATAFLIPDAQVLAQLDTHRAHQQPEPESDHDSLWRSWWQPYRWNPSADLLPPNAAHDVFESVSTKFQSLQQDLSDRLDYFLTDDTYLNSEWHSSTHPHKKPNQTIYQLINQSKYTSKFATLVNEHADIVHMLNSTKAGNYTLFAPIDAAFDHIPKDKKPSKEFIHDLLKYHIGLGEYPAGRVLFTHTLPTALDEPLLGDKPQRLRTSVGVLSGVRVNFYSKVVAVDIPATNGYIHAVRSILVPPPYVGRELTLFPGAFSTLLLAYDKTNFTSFIHDVKMVGSTVFAPDNDAFAKLGPAANAFLFNTEKGLRYLKALLKYHVVPDETVYSDAYYSGADGIVGEMDGGDVGRGHYHLDVPTLLGDKNLAIDIARYGPVVVVKLNGYITVKVQDAVAKNGVIHIPSSVLIPPHNGRDGRSYVDGVEISVEELMERLEDFVDESDPEPAQIAPEVEL